MPVRCWKLHTGGSLCLFWVTLLVSNDGGRRITWGAGSLSKAVVDGQLRVRSWNGYCGISGRDAVANGTAIVFPLVTVQGDNTKVCTVFHSKGCGGNWGFPAEVFADGIALIPISLSGKENFSRPPRMEAMTGKCMIPVEWGRNG
ncbi:exo-alpha-sialidase [Trypanosoma cruzi]|nr:exo-alpha-sialidase [Trypanosoma cruzi]